MDKKVILAILIVILGGFLYYLYTNKQKENVSEAPVQTIPWQQNVAAPAEEKKEEVKPEIKNPTNYKEALEVAKTTNKKLFLYFTMDGCKYCAKMKETFNDEDVKKAMAPYLFYELNVGKEQDVAKKYGVEAVPAYFVVDPTNEQILKKNVGYENPRAFENWLGDEKKWFAFSFFKKKARRI